MYKFILAVAVVALTACGSVNTKEDSATDSTAVALPVVDTVVVVDSTAVTAPVDGSAQK
jgi:hypothetical protein